MNKTHLFILAGAAIAGYFLAPTLAGSTIPGVGTVFNKAYSLGQSL